MASLSTNTVNLRLNGTMLTGNHKDGKQLPLAGAIDLNHHISNVDGRLTWGGHGFYTDAKHVKLNGTRLSAELKNSAGHYVTTTLDIDHLLQNRNGVFEVGLVDQRNVGPITPRDTPSAEVTSFSLSGQSIDSMASSEYLASSTQHSSATSVTTSSSKHEVSSKTESHTFSYDMSAAYKLLAGNCRSIRLEGKTIHAECVSDNGAFKISHFNFESHIHKSARNIRLKGLIILLETFDAFTEKWIEASIDLNFHLRICNGSLVVYIPIPNPRVSEMFSTVPWLGFQVVAKPNFAELASSAWAQEFMSTVATTIVEDSIRTMKHIINTTVEKALEEVTHAAVSKLSVMVQTMVQAQASTELSMSSTHFEMLRFMTQKQMMNGLGMTGPQVMTGSHGTVKHNGTA